MIIRSFALFALCAPLVLYGAPALATDVALIGVFPGKAVLQINSGAPRTLSVGQKTAEGVSLVSVDREAAVLDIDGSRRTVRLGQQHAGAPASSAPSVTLSPDSRGHFIADGQINGRPVRFVLDTGATLVSLSAVDAERLGIDFRNGTPAVMSTANGKAAAWRLKLASVRIGDIRLDNVDAAVIDNQTMPVLLGMSFLNRMDLRRDGEMLTLTKRY